MTEYEEPTARGVTVKDVKAADFIKSYSEHLKRSGKMDLPKWADLVKTACWKELPPNSEDWYYVRAAAIARHVYLRPDVGIGGMTKKFGGKARRGANRNRRALGASGLIRHILLQLEENKVVEKTARGGRRITRIGQQDLDRIAGAVLEEQQEEE